VKLAAVTYPVVASPETAVTVWVAYKVLPEKVPPVKAPPENPVVAVIVVPYTVPPENVPPVKYPAP
jgi:hypothetical protein